MAVFLLKSKYGADYLPPPPTGTVFTDVPASNPFAPWIENLAALGVTGGCGSGQYCPNNPVTRAQMAVFLLKTRNGSTYSPPPGTGIFGDVAPCPGAFCDFIEDLYNQQITGGCQTSPLLYCPTASVLRQQMAVFLVKTVRVEAVRTLRGFLHKQIFLITDGKPSAIWERGRLYKNPFDYIESKRVPALGGRKAPVECVAR